MTWFPVFRLVRVVIFIGHHKVGSSALQAYLSSNWLALVRRGVLYPSVDFDGLAASLSRALRGSDEPIPGSFNVREPHNALAFRLIHEATGAPVPRYHRELPSVAQMLVSIRKQIEQLQPHTVVIVSEVFSNFSQLCPDAITRLARFFEGYDVQITATFRIIDDYLISWQGQRLRFGEHPIALRTDGGHSLFDSIHFNYQLLLQGWLEAFPEASFVLRDYAEVVQAGGACTDFIRNTALDIPPDLIAEPLANIGFHRAAFEMVRLGNRLLDASKAQALRAYFLERGHELVTTPSRDIEMFGSGHRAQLYDRFSSIHSYLGAVAGTSGFFQGLEQIKVCRAVTENEILERAANSARALARVDGRHDILDSLEQIFESRADRT